MDYIDTINYLAIIFLTLIVVITGRVYYKSYSRKLKYSKVMRLPVTRPINRDLYYFNPLGLSDETSNLYLKYSDLFNKNIMLRKSVNQTLKEHERNNLMTLKLLSDCNQIFKQCPDIAPFQVSLKKARAITSDLTKLEKVFIFKVPVLLLGVIGLLVGITIVFVLWSVIQSFGSASTGTPISSLHGAAEFNATLAQFGFGSKSSGGGGKALGVLVILVIVGVITWLFAENYVDYIIRKERQLRELSNKLQRENIKLSLQNIAIIDDLANKRNNYNQLSSVYKATYKSIYPNKWSSYYIKYKLGVPSNLSLVSNEHIFALTELEKLIRRLYSDEE